MRLVRTIATTSLIAGLTLAFGVVPAQSEPAKPEPGGAPPSAAAARVQAIEAQGARAQKFADAHGALTTYYDEARAEHVVVVPQGLPVNGAEAAKAVGAPTRIEQRDITKGTIESVEATVVSRSFAPDAGSYTYATYFDGPSGKVVVKTDAPASVTDALAAQFGDAVQFRPGGPHESYSRRADTPAYWGGSSVTSNGWICTSNFVVQKNGTRYLATAGHCFSQGWNVYTTDGGAWVGSVVQRASYPTFDMELIGGSSYGSYIYTGGTNSSTGKHVASAGDPIVGVSGYCFSGQTSGEVCGERVDSVDATVCTSGGCTPHMIQFAGTAPLHGDSGAPFYWQDSSSVYARGLIADSDFAGTGWAEKWSRISSTLGVTIVT